MRKGFLAVAFVISLIFASQAALAGVGVSPASFSFEKMVRSGYSETYISVSNPTDEPTIVNIGTEGEISGWLTAEPEDFNMTGMGSKIVKLVARVPSTAPNGVYTGRILVVAKPNIPPEELGGNTISVASVVIANAVIEVSDQQILQYKVEGISLPDTEECRPILLTINIRNTGNVNVTPSFSVSITGKGSGTEVQKYDYKLDSVLPTHVAGVTLHIPYKMEQFQCIPQGDYTAHVKSYSGDSIMDASDLDFHIYPRGTLSLAGELMEIKAPNNITLGDVAKIDALFKNTGQILAVSKFNAEIYESGRLVSTVSSEETEVGPGSIVPLSAYFTPNAGGHYKILGTVKFEEKTSNIVEAAVDVLWPTSYYLMGAGVIVILIVAAAFLLKRRKK